MLSDLQTFDVPGRGGDVDHRRGRIPIGFEANSTMGQVERPKKSLRQSEATGPSEQTNTRT